MDLVIALEMSRLQLIEDEVRKQRAQKPGTTSAEAGSDPALIEDYSEEAQLRLAIHLSLQESLKKAENYVSVSGNHPENQSKASTSDYWSCGGRTASSSLGDEAFTVSKSDRQQPDTSISNATNPSDVSMLETPFGKLSLNINDKVC